MASNAGKGDKRIKESKPGSCAEGWDTIYGVPLICAACNTEPCDCQRTEDGPGQDEAPDGGES